MLSKNSRASTIAVLCGLFALVSPRVALAYEVATSMCPGGLTWANPDVPYDLNATTFPGGLFQFAQFADAVADTAVVLNGVHGTEFAVNWSGVINYNWNPSVADNRNDVGFPADNTLLGGALAMTRVRGTGCTMSEFDLLVRPTGAFNPEDASVSIPWVYGSPEQNGTFYYFNPNYYRGTSGTYESADVRPVLLHEFLHVAGLQHSDTSYAFMNTSRMPYSNDEDPDARLQPLPDDREGLRALYPVPLDRERDMAVLTTWYDRFQISPGGDSGLLAVAKNNCQPSGGLVWRSDDPATTTRDESFGLNLSERTCGLNVGTAMGAVTNLCAGAVVRTRISVVNYGNLRDEPVTIEGWYSLDDQLDTTVDYKSPDVYTSTICAQCSFRQGRVFHIPSSIPQNQSYYLIPRIVTQSRAGGMLLTGEQSTRNNWMPFFDRVGVGGVSCVMQ